MAHLIKRYDMMYSIHHIIKIVKRLVTAEHADDAEKVLELSACIIRPLLPVLHILR